MAHGHTGDTIALSASRAPSLAGLGSCMSHDEVRRAVVAVLLLLTEVGRNGVSPRLGVASVSACSCKVPPWAYLSSKGSASLR